MRPKKKEKEATPKFKYTKGERRYYRSVFLNFGTIYIWARQFLVVQAAIFCTAQQLLWSLPPRSQ